MERAWFLPTGSQSTEGTASSESKATVEVSISKTNGTYWIKPGVAPSPPTGKLHHSMCIPNQGCKESDTPISAGGCFPGEVGGKLTDPNQLHGELNDVRTGIGRLHNGTYTYNVKWDLGRQGSTQ